LKEKEAKELIDKIIKLCQENYVWYSIEERSTPCPSLVKVGISIKIDS
jgi:hypothetical protein